MLFVNSLSLLANSFTKLVSPSPKKALYQVPSMEFTLWCRSSIEEVSKVYVFFWFFALISYVYMINLNLYSCRLCAKFDWNVSMSKWFHHLGMHLQYLRMYVQYLVIYIQISCDVYFITLWCKCNHCILGDTIQSLLEHNDIILQKMQILLYMQHMIWNILNKILSTHYKVLHKYHKI